MSKGGVILVVGVGAAVVLIGGIAMAATGPATVPILAPPPPPPAPPSLGTALVQGSVDLYNQANKNEWVNAYTNGQSAGGFAKDYLINPYYSLGKGAYGVGKKLLGKIF